MKFNLVKRTARKYCALWVLVLLSFTIPVITSVQAGQNITLAWDPSPGSDIAGYNIYYGAASGSYTNRVPVGNVTNATVKGLIEGSTYYFAATAMNTSGLESDLSNEVAYSAPGSPNQPPTLNSLPDMVLSQNAPQQTVNLSGITSGSVTEVQPLTVSALSSNPGLIPNPTVSYSSPATTGVLRFTPVPQASGSATITVSVSDGQSVNGTTSRSFAVVVQAGGEPPPVITSQPVSQTVVAGADVTLAVGAIGSAPLTYQWKKNGAVISGGTQSSLTLKQVNAGHQGNYSVVVSNRGGSATSASAVLTVNPAEIPSIAAGSYSGLFFEPNTVSHLSSGMVALKSTAKRTFTGSLTCAGKRFSISGQFDAVGSVSKTIPRKNQNALTVRLQLDSADQDKLTGTVSDGTFTAELTAYRAVFDGRQQVAPQEGSYTLVIPGTPESRAVPGGDSFGTVRVSKAGRIRLAGALADGTKVSQSATLSKNGEWSLYAALYGGQGSILSQLSFAVTPPTDFGGDVVWIKPSFPRSKLYPSGFAVEATASGYSYKPPGRGTNVLALREAVLSLSGGDLMRTLGAHVLVGPGNRVTDLTGRRLNLTFSTSAGTFSGRILDPSTLKTLSFRGIAAQGINVGRGYFTGESESGRLKLEARQP